MSSELQAIVVEHGGISYICVLRAGYNYNHDRVAANGVEGLLRAPGDNQFLMYEGTVETLERIIPPRKIVTKYLLREDLRGSAKDEIVSVDQYRTLSESDRSLYRAEQEDIPQQAEPIPFGVQREGGPPSTLPKGVVCTDKNSFARFPSFWHLGPVRATARYVLYRLALRFGEIFKDNPYLEWSSRPGDWEKEILCSSYEKESFFIRANAMIVNGISVSPVGLKSHFTISQESARTNYAQLVSAVDGDSLEDLMAKVARVVEAYTAQARAWTTPSDCPCCKRRFVKPAVKFRAAPRKRGRS